MNIEELVDTMNQMGSRGEAFVFGVDFEMDRCFLYADPLNCDKVYFDFNGIGNFDKLPVRSDSQYVDALVSLPISLEQYKQKFNVAYDGLHRGDSFLLNLTVKTELENQSHLQDIFEQSQAKYRLYIPGEFCCFSPETFVRIQNGTISSFPMKGTIDSSLPNAIEQIMSDYKELAEHFTIVDLIRNDLSVVAHNTRVERFRYVDLVDCGDRGSIYQVSSEVCADLRDGYQSLLGTIITSMLPAGSVSGAPKQSTLDIIRAAEGHTRGYYCGVAGYFDGLKLDSTVLIRYIEEQDSKLYYRSGGGITINSSCQDEYNEVMRKIYLPR